jgi:hypothetical protein
MPPAGLIRPGFSGLMRRETGRGDDPPAQDPRSRNSMASTTPAEATHGTAAPHYKHP